MRNAVTLQGCVGGLALVTLAAGMLFGCGSTKSGGQGKDDASAGAADGTRASGGVTGTGGVVPSGGITGGGGVTGNGGTQASGGVTGTSGIGSGGIGAGGGTSSGGVGSGGVANGGTGGRSSGGAGGAGTGGTSVPDAGCMGASCALDAGPTDAPMPTCSQITTQSACDLRGDCHSVFENGSGCSCDGGGCCMQFSRCTDGGRADCTGPALCKSMSPNCPAPYAVSYSGSCYEGCVRQSECPTPTCPAAAPSNATACGPVDYTCFYESCATTGRTLATCSSGTWRIETAACTSVTCPGGGTSPGSLTCDAGKVCVVLTSIGGVYMVTPMCVDSACGAGPVTPQCIPSAYGDCSMTTGLSGVIVRCSYSSCGSGQGGCA